MKTLVQDLPGHPRASLQIVWRVGNSNPLGFVANCADRMPSSGWLAPSAADAEELYKRALAIKEKALGADPTNIESRALSGHDPCNFRVNVIGKRSRHLQADG